MDADTEIGGPSDAFPETHDSAIIGTRSTDAERRSISYEEIVSAYWKPVYRYIRIKWGKSNEDAKDLTQGFFTLVIDRNFAAGYEPSQARFRTYLRVCLDRFLANQHKFEGRLKRSAELIALDENLSSDQTIDDTFQREWTRMLFARTVDRLRERLAQRGKSVHFEIFERYDMAPDNERPKYDDLAAELNLSTANLTNYLASARREFRVIVHEELRQITGDGREFRREVLTLLRV
jgi:RNA polymerase sigma factor (sigma-70 family)